MRTTGLSRQATLVTALALFVVGVAGGAYWASRPAAHGHGHGQGGARLSLRTHMPHAFAEGSWTKRSTEEKRSNNGVATGAGHKHERDEASQYYGSGGGEYAGEYGSKDEYQAMEQLGELCAVQRRVVNWGTKHQCY